MRTFETLILNNQTINLLTLPDTNVFKLEIVSCQGSNEERESEKNIYGLSHFVEHLSFKSTRDYTSEELLFLLKNKGVYNASTDFEEIMYYFQTTSTNAKLAINLVFNYAFNNLKKINKEEFETEKKVVLNEIKRCQDDSQYMFNINIFNNMFNLDTKDNILGSIKHLKNVTLKDAIQLKEQLMKYKHHFNIVYDPNSISKENVLKLFSEELNSWEIPETILFKKELEHSFQHIKTENDADQNLTAIVFNATGIPMNQINALTEYVNLSSDSSLTDVIREQNGLTYGISFDHWIQGKNQYITFSCDVSKGSEKRLLKLFEKSIKETFESLTIEKFNTFKESQKLQSFMSRLSQEEYFEIFDIVRVYPDLLKSYDNLDLFFDNIIEDVNFEDFKNWIQYLHSCVYDKKYTIIKNY